MAYRQFTRCYQHTPGDKPFNIINIYQRGIVIKNDVIATAFSGSICA